MFQTAPKPIVLLLAWWLAAPAVADDPRPGGEPATRTVKADKRFLHLPVNRESPIRRVQVKTEGGEVVRDFDIRLGDGPADFATFLDLEPFRGRTLTISANLPATSKALGGITLSDQLPGARDLYGEADRPRFHFTSRRGWLNDPNGLVWNKGEYHLFYQHNPYGWDWGNMHWGHARSRDLIHWEELPIALYPHKYGDWAFSGSAVVDAKNTSGFGSVDRPAMVAAYTSTGRGECIVWSVDGGRTWAEFAGNPVVKHNGRDPRLFWHEPTRRWIMAVYEEGDGKTRAIAFHSSPDLKAWTRESQIDGFYECPDLFELPVKGSNPPRSLWVLSAADGQYRLGQFDGHRFTPETPKLTLWHGDFYAAQTFSDTPDGRRIQIGWSRGIDFPGMPFNQQMTVPCELTLRATAEGPRLCAEPVAEFTRLHISSRTWTRPSAGRDEDDLGSVFPRIEAAVGVDLTLTSRGEAMGGWTATLYGSKVSYDPAKQALNVDGLEVPLQAESDQISVRIVADRRSLEVFGNNGRVAASRRVKREPGAPALEITTSGASDRGRSLRIEDHTLRPAW